MTVGFNGHTLFYQKNISLILPVLLCGVCRLLAIAAADVVVSFVVVACLWWPSSFTLVGRWVVSQLKQTASIIYGFVVSNKSEIFYIFFVGANI